MDLVNETVDMMVAVSEALRQAKQSNDWDIVLSVAEIMDDAIEQLNN